MYLLCTFKKLVEEWFQHNKKTEEAMRIPRGTEQSISGGELQPVLEDNQSTLGQGDSGDRYV